MKLLRYEQIPRILKHKSGYVTLKLHNKAKQSIIFPTIYRKLSVTRKCILSARYYRPFLTIISCNLNVPRIACTTSHTVDRHNKLVPPMANTRCIGAVLSGQLLGVTWGLNRFEPVLLRNELVYNSIPPLIRQTCSKFHNGPILAFVIGSLSDFRVSD